MDGLTWDIGYMIGRLAMQLWYISFNMFEGFNLSAQSYYLSINTFKVLEMKKTLNINQSSMIWFSNG